MLHVRLEHSKVYELKFSFSLILNYYPNSFHTAQQLNIIFLSGTVLSYLLQTLTAVFTPPDIWALQWEI